MWNKDSGDLVIIDDGDIDSQRVIGTLDSAKWEIAAVGNYNDNAQEDLLIRELTSGRGGLSYLDDASGAITSLNSSIANNMGDNKFEIIA